jgi:ketosteroid isomerase-like protein
MSQENVELHYRLGNAFNRRDLDAFLALVDPKVEFISYVVTMEGTYRGHDGIRRWWQDLFEVFPDWKVEAEVRDLGDLTLMHGRLRGQGATSGAPFERPYWAAVEWRDEQVVWWSAFGSEAEALDAVGLRE